MLLAMDDWHWKLARDLVQGTPTGTLPDAAAAAAAALEIAFGQARSVIAYALELARAHRIPAVGNVAGDDVWLQLGEGRVRFTLNRRSGAVVVQRPGHPEVNVSLGDGDLAAMAREALDGLVTAWRSSPANLCILTAPAVDPEDMPTKA
jgi:hypothetical protein